MSSQTNLSITTRHWGLLFVLSVIWGGSFIFVELGLEGFGPIQMAFLRVAMAAFMLGLALLMSQKSLACVKGQWGKLVFVAFFTSALPFALIAAGQTYISAGLASIINAATPIMALVFAHFFTMDEKLTTTRLLGVILGFIGVGILVGPAAILGETANLLGMILVLLGTMSYGVAGVLGRRLKGIPPMTTACLSLAFSAVWLFVPMLMVEGLPSLHAGLRPWLAVLGIALLSSALAYIIYFTLVSQIGAGNTMLVTLLAPVTAIFLGVILFGDVLPWRACPGLAFIGLGLLIIDGRLISRFPMVSARK